MTRKPFVGAAGRELFDILGQAFSEVEPELHARVVQDFRYGPAWIASRQPWLEAAGIAMTNVLALRPPDNKIDHLCGSKLAVGGKSYTLPALAQGKYLRPEFLPEIDRLVTEIETLRPNLIVAMGNTALWALTGARNIAKTRGAIQSCRWGKLLPTYHPAAVLYQWAWRPILVVDLLKAARECQFPEVVRPSRQIQINPTPMQMVEWRDRLLHDRPAVISCDIETMGGQIKCVGVARSPSDAMVVPFIDLDRPDGSYWPTIEAELFAWEIIDSILGSGIPIVGQNFLYDLQYLMPAVVPVRNVLHDTMLRHHSMFPELPKGLDFLGSVYTNEVSWKLMRLNKADTVKRDE